MPRTSIGDCSLYYERNGTGFPVLFISGLGGFASFWQDQVAAFAKRFEVVTFDHRGIGQSDEGRIGYTVERMAADVISLMGALRIKRAHLVGHSTGGAIAQVLAIEHPSRLAAVVLSATWTKADAYFRRLFTLRKEVLLRLGPSTYLQSATLYWYPSWWVARNNERLRQLEAQNLAAFAPIEIVASRIDAMLAFDRTSELARIKTPDLGDWCRRRRRCAGLFFRGAGPADSGGGGQAVSARRALSDAGPRPRIQQCGTAFSNLSHPGLIVADCSRKRLNLGLPQDLDGYFWAEHAVYGVDAVDRLLLPSPAPRPEVGMLRASHRWTRNRTACGTTGNGAARRQAPS